jgi:hypothetical protein
MGTDLEAQFLAAVGAMRTLQRRYFQGRRPADLQEAKAAERHVDRLLEQLTTEHAQGQGSLF